MKELAMKLMQPSPFDEARRYCFLRGWHYNGTTRAMFEGGGTIELPEALADYAAQITAERDELRRVLADSFATKLPEPIRLTVPAPEPAAPDAVRELAAKIMQYDTSRDHAEGLIRNEIREALTPLLKLADGAANGPDYCEYGRRLSAELARWEPRS